MTRPLIVTDKAVAAAGLLDRLLEALPKGLVPTIYDGTPANPTEAAVREAAALYRAAGCDGVVSLGGGSAIDLAKAAGLALTHRGPLLRYAAVEGGINRITDNMPPHFAIPTTAETGSEVGRGALIIHIEAAAPLAERDHTTGTNPRHACAEDYRTIMHAAL